MITSGFGGSGGTGVGENTPWAKDVMNSACNARQLGDVSLGSDILKASFYGKTIDKWTKEDLWKEATKHHRFYGLGGDREDFYTYAWKEAKQESVKAISERLVKIHLRNRKIIIAASGVIAAPVALTLVIKIWELCVLMVVM
jgi:hypothetical protein